LDQEIIITAQKREQDAAQVPLAISVIGAEKLARLQVSNSRDLSGLAPNVTILPGLISNSAAIIAIRGISSPASETFGLDAANGLYIDGIYIARSAVSGLEIADTERVEILRGPQGTLFGRNTTGGAVAFVSRKPQADPGVRAELGVGNFGAARAQVRLDTGEIASGLTASLSYAHRQREGTVDNLLEPVASRDPGAVNADSIRLALRFEPSPGGYFQYIFDWSEVNGSPPAFQLTNLADGRPPAPLVIEGAEVAQILQAPALQYVAAGRFTDPACAAVAAPTRQFRRSLCLNAAAPATDRIEGHNFQAGNDFGDFAVRLVAGYRKWRSNSRGSDFDGLGAIEGPVFTSATLLNGLPEPLLGAILPPQSQGSARAIAAAGIPTTMADLFLSRSDRRHEQFSSELEVSGEADRLDWVAGAFHFWERGQEDNPQTSGFVVDTDAIFRDRFGALGPSLAGANPARYRLAVTEARLEYIASAQSTAVYGHLTFYPGGRDGDFSMTAGGRYTWDEKAITRTQNGVVRPDVPETGRARFDKFTWTLAAHYEFLRDTSAYARIATGFRSGGFNASDPTPPLSSDIPAFAEESLTSYELGFKSQLFGGRLRLNLAAYHNVFDDLAVTVPTLTGTGTFQSRVNNAGRVEYTGIEAEWVAQIGRGFWIEGAFGHVDVDFREFVTGQPVDPAQPLVDLASIARAGLISPFTASLAINARTPVGAHGAQLIGRIGYVHEAGRYSFTSVVTSPFNDVLKGDDADLFDAQAGIENITLGAARVSVMVWVKNLTDDANLVRAIDFGPLGFGGGIFNDPRTYGVTLGLSY
jgi:iron complex outermembrane receptor protein